MYTGMHAAARRSAWAALVVAFLYLAGLQDARAGKVGHVRHFNKLTLTVTPEYCHRGRRRYRGDCPIHRIRLEIDVLRPTLSHRQRPSDIGLYDAAAVDHANAAITLVPPSLLACMSPRPRMSHSQNIYP